MTPTLDHHDPHTLLGLHLNETGKVIRLHRPGATEIYAEVEGNTVPFKRIGRSPFFEYAVPDSFDPLNYKVYHPSGLLAHDPYAFLPTIGDVDLHLFGQGVHYKIYNILGAHRLRHQGVFGVQFAVWAPSARSVALVADFNHWNGLMNPMRSLGQSGIWEIFIPGLTLGEKYKFEIKTSNGRVIIKTDPYANQMEMRPKTASLVADVNRFAWSDQEWLESRRNKTFTTSPMNVYELHAGSWRKEEGRTLNYRELAVKLAVYCKEVGYTHVEFLPLQEHPLDESWGYQVSGFYAPTSRYGSIEDLQWLVNYLHNEKIGVLLDWVPGHFPTDDFSLARFDGTALYEHEDPRQGFHPHWHTNIFNFGRKEVSNFLIANAHFWFEKLHIDGLRVDAVASMLYLDYGRKEGEWIPNIYGRNENLEAVEFFKHLNSSIKQHFPGVVMIAEESTAFPKITCPVAYSGLGFDMKWNMGWMNDTLRYLSKDPIYRQYHQNDLTFGQLYAYTENFCAALSHDEVVHGKKSLLSKMPGDWWQKFANLRLCLSYQMCQPGKKLLFMGAELGVWNEWYCKDELDWRLLEFPSHQSLHRMVKELNHFYLNTPALYERDFNPTGFSWVDFEDKVNGVIAYLRKSSSGEILCVHHFSPNYSEKYFLKLPNVASIEEVFNTDADQYGGSNKVNPHIDISPEGITFQLAPLATMIFAIKFN